MRAVGLAWQGLDCWTTTRSGMTLLLARQRHKHHLGNLPCRDVRAVAFDRREDLTQPRRADRDHHSAAVCELIDEGLGDVIGGGDDDGRSCAPIACRRLDGLV